MLVNSELLLVSMKITLRTLFVCVSFGYFTNNFVRKDK